jgi:hypothetical protein
MGKLNILSRERSLVVYDLDGLAARLEESFPLAAPLPRFLFARNDWLEGAALKALVLNNSIRLAFNVVLADLSRDLHEIPDSVRPVREQGIGLKSRTIHDMRCYLTRLYIGADDGVFDWDVDWQDGELASAPRTRLDARCYSLGTGYGVVTASCGKEGLFSAFGEYEHHRHVNERSLRRTAARSVRSGWIGRNLLNYGDNASASLYEAKREPRKSPTPPGVRAAEQEAEDTVVTALKETRIRLSQLLWSEDTLPLGLDDVQYAFNSPQVVFVRTYDGMFHSWRWQPPTKKREGRFVYRKNLEPSAERVLRASVSGAGVVVETDERVRLFSSGKWITLYDGPVISVRTFLSSRRFKNLIAITAEEGVWLVSVVDFGSEASAGH